MATTRRLLIDGTSFTELGIQRIAAEAGVARSTFYAHFRDKSELLMRLAGATAESSFGFAGTWEPTGGIEVLIDTFSHILGVYRENLATINAINEMATYDATVRDFWRERLNRFLERTSAVLRDQQAAGHVQPDLDIDAASRIIVLGGERAIVDHVTTRDRGDDAAFARELSLIWWYGAYRRPATGTAAEED